MKLSYFILKLLQFIVDTLVISLKRYEDISELDADGIPLSPEWERQSFLLSLLRDTVSNFENAIKEKIEDEKQNS